MLKDVLQKEGKLYISETQICLEYCWWTCTLVWPLWNTVWSFFKKLKIELAFCCWWCSVTKLCSAVCDSMASSTPSFPVLHYLLEFAQTHIHWVSDAIPPSHPLSPPSPPTLSLLSIKFFSNELALCIRWPKNWNIIFSISSSNKFQCWFPLRLTGLISLLPKGFSRVFTSTTIQKHQFFSAQPPLWPSSHIQIWLLEKPELWLKRPLLAKECLCFLICCLGWVIAFLSRSKGL